MVKKYCIVAGAVLSLCVSCLCFCGEKEIKEEARELLAQTYMASGQHQKAIEVYEQILVKEPNNTKVRIALADLLSWVKRYDESISEYKKVIEKDPDNIEAKKKLAAVYGWNNELDKSEALYREILEVEPGDDVYVELAQILTWKKEYGQAIEYFSRGLKDKAASKADIVYGRALLYSGQYALAKQTFLEILKSYPNDLEVKTYLADAYAYSKDFDKAISLYEEILKKNEDSDVMEKLADVLSWSKNYTRAIELYDSVLEKKYDKKVHRQKARVLGWSRQYEKAIQEYRKILDEQYDEVIDLEMLAKSAYWNGRHKAAIEKYRELIDREEDNVEAMFDLSQVYSYQEMWQEAVSEYEKILNIYPAHFRARAGKEKAELIWRHPRLDTSYRFFEADSIGRGTDIRKYEGINNLTVPFSSKLKFSVDYGLTKREFSDYPDITENTARIGAAYLNKPDWTVSAYYGAIGYNKDLDEVMHLCGGRFWYRIIEAADFTFSYDKERLENNSAVIRRYFDRHKMKQRFDFDVNKRLKTGLDYSAAYYSDDNLMQEPGIDIAYKISLEPRSFLVKYRYYYTAFRDKKSEYFSPMGFSTNEVTLGWRHFLNKEEIFFGADDIYYDLGYVFTIDSDNIAGHKFSCAFCWDINKRLNLNIKGAVRNSSASVYEEGEIIAAVKWFFR